jgi:long-chain acyl-CoA synthetase
MSREATGAIPSVEALERQYGPTLARILRAEHEHEDPVTELDPIPVTFERAVDRFPDEVAQQYKGGVYDRSLVAGGVLEAAPEGGFAGLEYERLRGIVRRLATGFRSLGVERGDRVAIFANTRMEWAQSDLALLSAGAAVTTVYESSSVDRVRYLLSDPGAVGVVAENAAALERVLAVAEDTPVEFVVTLDDVDTGAYDAGAVDLYTLAAVHERGVERYDAETYEGWLAEATLDDLASVIYTSGTTGRPKGVRLTHRNFRSNMAGVQPRLAARPDKAPGVPAIDETDTLVSFLPLAHVFERLFGHFSMLANGVTVAYAESPDTLRADFQAVGPTVATSVPRVYEKIYDAVRTQARETTVAGLPVGERVFNWAVDVGRAYDEAETPGPWLRLRRGLADRLVYADVREALGGNLEMMISGGGSLSPDLARLYGAMGLRLVEGYGLTETSPVVAVNVPEHTEVGSFGVPLINVETRIDESLDLGGHYDDLAGEVGELLVRGPSVTEGYWNAPEETAAAFTEAGYFRTGDVVHRRPDGYLVFLERAKQLLVLSTGQNVAPSPIEDAFVESELVEQCLVVGDSRKFVSALVVPNLDRLRALARDRGVSLPADPAAVCLDAWARDRVQAEIDRVNDGLDGYETIKKFRLVPEEWTEANGLLTPSQKKRRRDILARYADQVEEMYAERRPQRAEPAD